MKKLLALVLALVMTLGLATVGSNAAFKDADSIEFEEAAAVMNAIGVLQGDETGAFNPTQSLTREQGAKIISYMLMGGKDGGDALTASAAPFSDVAADRWSAGAIAYCKNAGILAGKGDGTFGPTEPLTGYAFAKMMLTALGYESDREGFVGNGWELNVAKFVNQLNLAKGLGSLVFSANITREQAAQMAFNTLTRTMVQYVGGMNVVAGDVSVKESVAAGNIGNTAYTYDNSANTTMQFCENYFPLLKVETATDSFGMLKNYWYMAKNRTDYARTDAKTVASAPAADKVLTYTAEVKNGTIYSDLGLNANVTAANTKVVRNGRLETDGTIYSTGTTNANTFAITRGGDAKIGGNGTVVYVYEDPAAAGQYFVIVEDTFTATVASVTAATSSADRKISLTLHTQANKWDNTTEATDVEFETEEFAKKDIVAYTAAYNTTDNEYEIKSVTALTKSVSEAVVSGYTGGNTVGSTNFTADGTTYKYAANAYNKNTTIATKAKVDLYLDAYGYVLYMDTTDTSSNFAVVLGRGTSTGTYGDSATTGATLLLNDGTTVTATTKDSTFDDSTAPSVGAYAHQEIVTYSVNSKGEYTLTAADTTTGTTGVAAAASGTNAISHGKSAMQVGGTTYYATSDTVFFIAKKSSATAYKSYSVYTGYANVPTIETGAVVATAYKLNGTKVEAVYFVVNEVAGTSSDTIYVLRKPSVDVITSTDVVDYVEMPAVINGEATTLKVAYSLMDGAADALYAPGGYILSSIAKDSDEIVTSVNVAGNSSKRISKLGIKEAGGGVIGLGEATPVYMAYTDDTVVVTVKADKKSLTVGEVGGITADANDQIVYVTNDDGDKVTAIYIQKIDANAETVKVTWGSVANLGGVYFDTGCNYEVTKDSYVAKGTTLYIKLSGTVTVDSSYTLVSGTANTSGAVYSFAVSGTANQTTTINALNGAATSA